MLQKILVYKKQLMTAGIIFVCLVLYGIFPTGNVFQQIISSIAFLLVIPLLYIKIILKEPLEKYGIGWGERRQGVIWMGLSLLASLLIFYILLHYTSLPQKFQLPELATERFSFFVMYELLLVGLFALLYEFFFRGLTMLGLKELGTWSVAIQSVVFASFFAIIGSFDWSTILFTIISPFAGIAAYRSKSLLYSLGTSLLFIIIADALAIGLIK